MRGLPAGTEALLVAAIGALLVACAGSPAERRTEYLLRVPAAEGATRIEAPVSVGLGHVEVAPYLDRAGIVVEMEQGQVQEARLHQWAEPLEDGLRSLLRGELTSLLGYEVRGGPADPGRLDYTVDVYVDQLHANMAGSALLVATYRIQPRAGAEASLEKRYSGRAPLPREGFPGVVDAEAALARQLAEAISASLQELERAKPGG